MYVYIKWTKDIRKDAQGRMVFKLFVSYARVVSINGEATLRQTLDVHHVFPFYFFFILSEGDISLSVVGSPADKNMIHAHILLTHCPPDPLTSSFSPLPYS